MNRLREFWIQENKKYPEQGPKYFCSSCAPRPVAVAMHVREVDPDYEEALSKLLTAVDFYFDPDKNSLPCYIDLKEAYKDWQAFNSGEK